MATDPSRVMIGQILGAVAQYDKAMIVARLRGARMRKKLATGRCEGVKPFGFEVGEDTAILRMKALRAEGLGYDRIAQQMNAEAIPTRTGKPWHGIVINRILSAQAKVS
jgi:DNA invertase Pin-like site-specific DNA recombinase